MPAIDSKRGVYRWLPRSSRRQVQFCTAVLSRAVGLPTWNLEARNRPRRRHLRESPKLPVRVPSVQIWIDVGLSGSGPLTTQRPCLLPSMYGPSWTAPPT